MMEIVIGTAAGVVAAMVCTLFYTKGVRDGMRVRRGLRKKVRGVETAAANDDQVRKFDAILDYDPYGTKKQESMEV